jgi:hypothetical protein
LAWETLETRIGQRSRGKRGPDRPSVPLVRARDRPTGLRADKQTTKLTRRTVGVPVPYACTTGGARAGRRSTSSVVPLSRRFKELVRPRGRSRRPDAQRFFYTSPNIRSVNGSCKYFGGRKSAERTQL